MSTLLHSIPLNIPLTESKFILWEFLIIYFGSNFITGPSDSTEYKILNLQGMLWEFFIKRNHLQNPPGNLPY